MQLSFIRQNLPAYQPAKVTSVCRGIRFWPRGFHNLYTIFYVQVDNVQSYLEKAGALGGKTLVPPVEIPTGTFAWFADADGNTIGLWKPK
jgi:predicted enzyme related to lactoylglutathione lyase